VVYCNSSPPEVTTVLLSLSCVLGHSGPGSFEPEHGTGTMFNSVPVDRRKGNYDMIQYSPRLLEYSVLADQASDKATTPAACKFLP